MSRSNRLRATVVLSALLLAAAPSFAAPPLLERGAESGAVASLLESFRQWLGGLWTAAASLSEEGDSGARIDGNGLQERAGARIDGNGDAGARIDGNGLY